ncbi:unnamed protein product [Lampetra fluviatilis]
MQIRGGNSGGEGTWGVCRTTTSRGEENPERRATIVHESRGLWHRGAPTDGNGTGMNNMRRRIGNDSR